MIGQKFNRLLVIGFAPKKRPKTSNSWVCKCDCGKETVVIGSRLIKGLAKSCGCQQREKRVECGKKIGGKYSAAHRKDLTGSRFGYLTVTHIDSVGDGTRWACVCECGTEYTAAGANLRRGYATSCGCKSRLRPFESTYRSIFYVNKKRKSTAAKYAVSLSYEEFLEFTKEDNCHYCLDGIKWGGSTSYNLDRKNNSVGYMKDNLVVCCKRCNKGKCDLFSYEDWYEMTTCLRSRRVTSDAEQVATPLR